MPYDPRPMSEGGNRGIDESFNRAAPKGKFRVIGVDTFDGTDWVSGDFASLGSAQEHVSKNTAGKSMLMMHIYDDQGNHVGSGGSF